MNLNSNRNVLLIINCLVMFIIAVNAYYDAFPDYKGPYCQLRGCCHDRQDNCSMPISTTLCYCDQFCDRTTSGDCCPDYATYCLRRPEPIRACVHKGQSYLPHTSFRDNCNVCHCNEEGRVDCEQNICLQDETLINNVNSISHIIGWRATNYSEFWGRTFDEGLRHRLGTREPNVKIKTMSKITIGYHNLPRHFNALEHWPNLISDIRDQGWCGSSWVLSATSVASDRFAIQSKGEEVVQLSPQHIMCCTHNHRACDGGSVDSAWRFLHRRGVVDESCYPYHPDDVRRVQKCPFPKRNNKVVPQTIGCSRHLVQERKHYYTMGPVYALNNETDVMYEIQMNGPVQATMRVYRDLFSYEEGIYRHTAVDRDDRYALHSVRIVGWGEEYSLRGVLEKYWMVANSWGKWWGSSGYFKILRGVNECGIEEFILASWADVYIKKTEVSIRNDPRRGYK